MIRIKALWNNIVEYKLNSILVKNFFVISLVLMIPLGGFSYIFFQRMNNTVEEEIKSINTASLEHLKDVTEGVFYDMDQMSLLFALDQNVRISFTADKMEPLILDQYENIFRLVESFTMIYDYVDSIYFYAEKTQYIVGPDGGTLETFRDKAWLEDYTFHPDATRPWILSRLKYDIYPYLITLVRPIFSDDRKVRLGSVLINIDLEEFYKFSRNERDGNFDRIFIADSKGSVVLSDSRADLFTSLYDFSWYRPDGKLSSYSYLTRVDGQSTVVSVIEGGDFGLSYVSLLPLVSYSSKLEEVLNYFLLILALCLATSLIFSVIISIRSFQPIYRIINLLEHPSLIAGKPTRGEKSSREVQLIADKIFRLINSNSELRNNLEERINQLNRARITALQSQIKPHFLYNTLETIRWLTVELTGEENRPSSMISSLSRLLRLSLDTQEEFITLEQELEHARNYLDLMMVRYEEKMSVTWDIDPGMEKYKTVKLILQPLIENAIYHGIKPLDEKGEIRISARRRGEKIVLSVSDNGPGMDRMNRERLNRQLREDQTLVDRHIGISNVNQRIQLMTGPEFGVFLKDRRRGLTAEILLPRKEPEEA